MDDQELRREAARQLQVRQAEELLQLYLDILAWRRRFGAPELGSHPETIAALSKVATAIDEAVEQLRPFLAAGGSGQQ